MVTTNPILVALDVETPEQALTLARSVEPHVGGFKVGLELLMGSGPEVISRLAELGLPVFADAKLHDIPNTVERAARSIGRHGARWLTVHAGGGGAMLDAAVSGLSESASGAGVLAVTVLTSLDDRALASIGVSATVSGQVELLAALAARSQVEGIVCSVHELSAVVRAAPGLLRVTPGVRPPGDSQDDQARVATPTAAVAAGADLLVIGRPITRAPDPVEAAYRIAASLGIT
jgi:orotidine-5'-phosphate decarboxylase